MTSKRIREAFETSDSLERLFKDKDSFEFFPDEVRAAKNFKNGYTVVERGDVLRPQTPIKSTAAKRPKNIANVRKGNNKPKYESKDAS